MDRLAQVCILILFLFILCACDTPMSKYEPINDTEKEIIGMMNQYLDARNSNDVNKLATLFDDNGEYIAGDGNVMKGKDGIANSDPDWWTYYGQQKLFNLKFNIGESNATVSTTGKWGINTKYPQVFTLKKEDGKWLFSKIAVVR